MDPGIDQGIAPILLEEVVTYTVLGDAWVNRTPWKVSRTVVEGIDGNYQLITLFFHCGNGNLPLH